jgi:hypothetical protein
MKYALYCDGHQAQIREGRPLAPLKPRTRPSELPTSCTFPGCDKPYFSTGYCRGHRAQMARGVTLTPLYQLRADVGYLTAHSRVRRTYGDPKHYPCVCGEPAAQWAYIGGEDGRMTDTVGGTVLSYSLSLDDYIPLCVKCHIKHDTEARLTRSTCPEGRWNS